ncbi:MAG TPA: PIN domain-containing protein [Candidatus Binatia bacterium]|nr:PIN domain-containing protein [Candidatus Binatia bacterium]
MIVVDTSVWINALRSRESPEFRHLSELLDADRVAMAIPVRVEILAGSARAQQAQLSRTLSALPLFYPSESTWRRIEEWLVPMKRAGEWFGVGDLLIAGIAAEHQVPVWSLDSDFARMARLRLISLHRPS